MKMDVEIKGSTEKKIKLAPPPPPPPPPPLPQSRATRQLKVRSVTRDEIDKFWRRKKMEEEDHLLAAIKAAARIRAQNLKEEEYRRFEESLKENDDEKTKEEKERSSKDCNNKEIRVGIKDWWTKSKYAYLNQPAIQSIVPSKRFSTYTPNNLCFYSAPPAQASFIGFSR